MSAGPDYPLKVDTEVDVKLVVDGSSLKGYAGGDLQCHAVDTDLVSGKSGLYSFKSKSTFDDVIISVIDSEPKR